MRGGEPGNPEDMLLAPEPGNQNLLHDSRGLIARQRAGTRDSRRKETTFPNVGEIFARWIKGERTGQGEPEIKKKNGNRSFRLMHAVIGATRSGGCVPVGPPGSLKVPII